MMPAKIEPGCRVAYSRRFLQSIGAYTGPTPFARGVVEALEDLGPVTLAVIRWDAPTAQPVGRVNVRNLVRTDRMHLEAA